MPALEGAIKRGPADDPRARARLQSKRGFINDYFIVRRYMGQTGQAVSKRRLFRAVIPTRIKSSDWVTVAATSNTAPVNLPENT
jgi:hypothetical protein